MPFYEDYRPKKFSDVIGQKATIEVLKAQARLGFFHHSYCFYGPSGSGKTSTARILAMVLNCENLDGTGEPEPCGKCKNCVAIIKGTHWDVLEVDGASQRGINDIRELKAKAYLYPLSKKKVYIIDEAHSLTEEAFNSLLKLLEEPPSHLVIILITTQIKNIPITVLSRCQKFEFKPLSYDDIKAKILMIARDWGIELDDEVINIIVRNAQGNLRIAENTLEQFIAFYLGGRDEKGQVI